MEELLFQPPLCDMPADGPDADAEVRLGASSNRMKLCVICYSPAQGNGRPLDAGLIREAARRAGVTVDLDHKALARVVDLLLSGRDARSVVIARGVQPGVPRDAWLEPLADLSRPVLTGMAIGRLHPARMAADGYDLAGNPLPASCAESPATFTVPPDAGCVLGEDGIVTATSFGLVEIGNGEIRVRPSITISPDRLTASAILEDLNALGERMVAMHIREELERLGLPVHARRIARALDEACRTREPMRDVVLATGLPPQNGRDAWVELLVQERLHIGTLDKWGCMDWWERGFHPVAEVGQVVARLNPPGEGVPGVDVFGQEIPAPPGRDVAPQPGRNVEFLEEEGLFRALAAGVVLVAGSRVEISELLVVPGDADLSTGNIRVRTGSVRILGSVRSGCVVEAMDCVQVLRAVENARITVGGDVVVAWGINMAPEGDADIQARGSVFASFAQNARIQAGGDVVMSRYISRSNVTAGFNVRAEGWVRVSGGRGRIMGGTVVGGRGIDVYEAGSSLGVRTVLVLTREGEEAQALVDEKRRLKRRVREIAKAMALALQEGPDSLAPEQKGALCVLSEERSTLVARIRDIGKELAALSREYLSRVEEGRIIVRGVAHPGVSIKMGGVSLPLTEPVRSCQFLWDRGSRAIKVAPL